MSVLCEINLTSVYKNDDDIHDHLKTNGILEKVYTEIARGKTIRQVSLMLNLPKDTTEYILTCTRAGREKLLSSKMFFAGSKSIDMIIDKSDQAELDAEESSALKHHRDIAKLAMQSQESKDKTPDTSITVINNTVVASDNDIPSSPEILKGII